MVTRERRLDRAGWLMGQEMRQLGDDLRGARLAAGLSLREVAGAVGVSAQTVLRVERARLPGANPTALARHAAAVGMRVRVKAYPDGEPLRDAAQIALMREFRSRLKSPHEWSVEVPVTSEPRDQRAWDATLGFPACLIALEFVSRLYDCQAQLRALKLKLRDGRVDRLVIVVKASSANRRALNSARDVLDSELIIDTRGILSALAISHDPGANGIVLL